MYQRDNTKTTFNDRTVTFAFPYNDSIKRFLVRVNLMNSSLIIAGASQAQEKAQPVTGWESKQQRGKNHSLL